VVERTPAIEIDAALVAPRLGLTVAEFRQLMDQRRITVLCERGVGEDAGRYRASFYYGAGGCAWSWMRQAEHAIALMALGDNDVGHEARRASPAGN
jgi:hypothetical protein